MCGKYGKRKWMRDRVREKRENHLRGPDCKGRNRQRVNEEKKERTHFYKDEEVNSTFNLYSV